jgi:hypothetical protein
MKAQIGTMIFITAILFTGISCKKDTLPVSSNPERSIKFLLHTEQDFSNDNDSIIFSVFIRSHTEVLFDSMLYSMKIKDIPSSANQLVFEKKVVGNNADLSVGFRYEIRNVGFSWYTDTCQSGQTSKVVDFSFH